MTSVADETAGHEASSPRPAVGSQALRSQILNLVCGPPAPSLGAFLAADDPARGLALWFGGEAVPRTKERLRAAVDRDIAEIDAKISRVVEDILADERLRKLEALWRSVQWLIAPIQARRASPVIVRILDLSWRDLVRDMTKSPEFDQSLLFQKVHNEEFGIAGGLPFGLLIGDFEISHRPSAQGSDDIAVLRELAKIAAAAFAPLILAAAPALFGVDSYRDLTRREDIRATFEQQEYRRFRTLQQADDSRFIGLAVGRLVMRGPYRGRALGDLGYQHISRHHDGVGGVLWTSCAFALAHAAVRAFIQFSWPAAIRGAPERDSPSDIAGGIIDPPAIADFETDRPLISMKVPIDVVLSERQEIQLNQLGFVVPRACQYTEYAALYNLPSIHRALLQGNAAAQLNSRMGAMLNYLLCVCRFAHYVKVIARDWVGAYKTAEDCERRLQDWINRYCIASDDTGYNERARYPLRRAQIKVRDVPGRPGAFGCQIQLQPHFQLDYIVSQFELTTEFDTSSKAA